MEFELILPIIFMMLGLGMLAGFLAGLLGIGGGLVTVPGLYFCLNHLGYDSNIMHVAIGSSLAMILFTGTSSMLSHRKKDSIDFNIVKIWGIGIAVGTLIGSKISSLLDADSLKAVFAFMTFMISIYMVFFKDGKEKQISKYVGVPFGLVIGTLSSIMGIGGALLSVPLMRYTGVKMQTAVGTASTMGLIIALLGSISYIYTGYQAEDLPPYSIGYINIISVLLVASMSIIFAKFGAKLAHLLPAQKLQYIFAGFIFLVSLYMFFS